MFAENEANYSKGRYLTQGGCQEKLGLSPKLAHGGILCRHAGFRSRLIAAAAGNSI